MKRERNTRRDNPSWLCGCGCGCLCGCWTCADGYHCAGDDCPHEDGREEERGAPPGCEDCDAYTVQYGCICPRDMTFKLLPHSVPLADPLKTVWRHLMSDAHNQRKGGDDSRYHSKP